VHEVLGGFQEHRDFIIEHLRCDDCDSDVIEVVKRLFGRDVSLLRLFCTDLEASAPELPRRLDLHTLLVYLGTLPGRAETRYETVLEQRISDRDRAGFLVAMLEAFDESWGMAWEAATEFAVSLAAVKRRLDASRFSKDLDRIAQELVADGVLRKTGHRYAFAVSVHHLTSDRWYNRHRARLEREGILKRKEIG